MENGSECPGRLILMPQFLSSVSELPKGHDSRIIKAINAFISDPSHPSLQEQRLAGKAIGLRLIRVDDSCRIVLSGRRVIMLLYAGTHDQASRFAERAGAEVTAMAESPIAHQLHDCADPLWVFAPEKASESPSCGVPISVDGLARLIRRTRKYLPLAHLLLSRGPEIGSMELQFCAIESALGTTLPKSARTGRKWWSNDPARAQAYSWMATGWKTEAVDLQSETVAFSRYS